jgi:hypothetical protein
MKEMSETFVTEVRCLICKLAPRLAGPACTSTTSVSWRVEYPCLSVVVVLKLSPAGSVRDYARL